MDINTEQNEVQPDATPQEDIGVENKSPMGPSVGIIVVVVIIILGGLYYFLGDSLGVSEDPVVKELETQSDSSELADIEKDLDATDLSDIDADLENIDAELSQ